MKIKLLVLLTLFFVLSGRSFSADNPNGTTAGGWCATLSPGESWESAFQKKIASFTTQQQTQRTQGTIYIPVIVHVIYWTNNTSQNITKAQVDSQINILNRDYAGASQFVGNVPTPFKPLIANTGISWCPAKIDRNGNVLAEPGIDRINARVAPYSFTNPGILGWAKDYIDGTIKPATIWNPKMYCNIWVVPSMSGGIIGYATFPTMTTLDGIGAGNATAETDGVVIVAFGYGKGGATLSPYNNGGTAAHELGHWLGLRHISGDAACGDDYVADTPPQSGGNSGGQNGLNYGCPSYPYHANGCSGATGAAGEMFMNYMDYTDDNCNSMFSNGQKARMLTTMANGDQRLPLQSSPVCDTIKPAPVADFKATLQSGTLCAASQTFNFTDKSLFAPTSWSWTFAGGTPATSSVQNPAGVVFNTAGLHTVSLTATNARGTSTYSKTITVSIIGAGAFPFFEGFEAPEFPPVGWNTVNRNGNPAINWDSSRAVGGFGASTACMRYDNTTLDGNHAKDDIVSPKINLTGVTAPKLKFDVAYAPYHDSTQDIYDTLVVLLTKDCEATVTQIYSKGGNTLRTAPGQGDEFYPTAAQWRTDSVVIPVAYQNVANVQVIFRNLGNYGHTIYVDNVNLNGASSNPTATASFTSSDTTVCAGGSLTFTNTSTASSGSPDSVRWTIPGGVPGTSASTTTVSPVFSTPGTYVISLVAYKGGSASTAYTKSIRVKSLPTVGVNSPTICSGATASLTGTGATTYTWSGGLTGSPTAVTPVLTTTTSYVVTGTTSGCTGTATATVTVNPNPTVGVNSPTICSGTTATLTGTGATTYTWTGGLTGSPTATTPVLSSTTTYTVTGTLNGCTNTAVSTVTVTPLPNVQVNSPGICNGQSATLTATGATSYTWSTSASGPSITVSPTSTTSYTVTGTTSGCSKTAVATVAVTNVPSVSVNSPTICSGQTATLTGSGATTYTWTGGLSGTPTVVTPVLTTTTSYVVTGTTNGCSSTATATVTVNPSPTVGVNSPTICSGTTASLTGTGATTYTWTGGLTGSPTATTPVLTNTTTYTVTGTLNGCTNTATSTVTVTPLPNVSVNSPSICSGSTASLTASGATSYTWTGGLAATATVTTPTLTSTTTYTVTGTTSGCSKTAVATVTVTSGAPTVVITPNPASTCQGDPVTLTAGGANNYTWTSSQTGTTTGGTLTFTPSGNITVNLSGTLTGCSTAGTTSVNVTVNSKPTVGVNSPSICSGTTASLTGTGATSYTWTGGLTGSPTATTPVLTNTTTYTVTGTGNGGCTSTAVATVTVKPLPNTGLSASSNSVCSGDGVTLTASGADSYSWSPSGSGTIVTINPGTSVTYTVTGTTNGCTKTASQSIAVTSVPTTPGITQSGDTLYSSVIIVGASYKWYRNDTLQSTTSTSYYKLNSSGNYTLKVVVNGCSSATSAVFSAVFTGIKNNKLDISYSIIPNPNNGDFEVRIYSAVNKKYSLALYNLTGQVILKDEMNVRTGANVKKINLNGIEKGAYIISISGDGGVVTQNIIVQ